MTSVYRCGKHTLGIARFCIAYGIPLHIELYLYRYITLESLRESMMSPLPSVFLVELHLCQMCFHAAAVGCWGVSFTAN